MKNGDQVATTAERRAHWSWVRNSPEAKLVNDMGKQYLESVKANERAAVDSKILKKKKSNERCSNY